MAIRQPSSQSADGTPVLVVAAATPGTLIHQVPANKKQTLYVEVYNHDTVARWITFELDGTAVPKLLKQTIQPQAGWVPVMVGHRFGTTVTMDIDAFAEVANLLSVKVEIIEE